MSEKKAKRQCVEMVHDSGAFRSRGCARNATVLEEGKWYCKVHAPSAAYKRAAARRAKWDRGWAEKTARHNRVEACVRVCEGVDFLPGASVRGLYDAARATRNHLATYFPHPELLKMLTEAIVNFGVAEETEEKEITK